MGWGEQWEGVQEGGEVMGWGEQWEGVPEGGDRCTLWLIHDDVCKNHHNTVKQLSSK